MTRFKSHGDGRQWSLKDIHITADADATADEVVIEAGTRIFFPHNLFLHAPIYIGHDCFLDAYHRGHIRIGNGSWVGPRCYIHGAGGVDIGSQVGIGADVKILTSSHRLDAGEGPIIESPVDFKPVRIEAGADIGVGSIILPGVHIGKGSQVGAGSVVTQNVEAGWIAVGVPAKMTRKR